MISDGAALIAFGGVSQHDLEVAIAAVPSCWFTRA